MFKTIELKNKKFLRVDFINPAVYRIRLGNENAFEENSLVRYGIVNAGCEDFQVKETAIRDRISFSTEKSAINVSKKNGMAELLNSHGLSLLSGALDPVSEKSKGFDISFNLDSSDRLYGFGDETRTKIQKRGHKNKIVVMNFASYCPVPFVMSKKGWGLFLNTTFFHYFDAGATDPGMLRFYSEKGGLDYFMIAGDSLNDILEKYCGITGKPHLLPKWGYGLTYICDERNVNAREMLYEAYEFRRQGIPCDTIGLEPDWMEEHYDYSVEKQWDNKRFHIPFWLKGRDFATFDAALKNMKFKLSLWLCCDYDLSEYEETLLDREETKPIETQNGFSDQENIFQDPHFYPQYLDKITKRGEPWFEHLKKFVDDGAAAFKLDGANQICFHPDRKWKNGMEDCEMHNLYPTLLNKQMSLGFKEHTGRRSMIFTSGGYAGIQRYSATWAGDTISSEDGDKRALVSMLNHGLSGHSNVCSDMEVWTKPGVHYGFFQTLSEVLSWHMYNQPWFLGEEQAELFKFYARLRYKLIPYIYSYAHIAAQTGTPVMRAMPLAFPDDDRCDDFIHQYMFGDFFLVAAFDDNVYLPEGGWIDFWTGETHHGSQVIPARFPENRGGPLFVKAGAIIPTQAVKNSIGADTPEEIIWDVYPKGKSEFTLCEDDGESYDYLNGKIARTRFECAENSQGFTITIHPRTGSYNKMPAKRTHTIRIFSNEKLCLKEPDIKCNYDSAGKILSIEELDENGGAISLDIIRNKRTGKPLKNKPFNVLIANKK